MKPHIKDKRLIQKKLVLHEQVPVLAAFHPMNSKGVLSHLICILWF